VLNNTKVLKARIKGRRKTGGAVEILLVRPLRDNVWECLLNHLEKSNWRGAVIKRRSRSQALGTYRENSDH